MNVFTTERNKGLTLGSFVISLNGVTGSDCSGTPRKLPPFSVGKITMIQQQMTGDVTVEVLYVDGVSQGVSLSDMLDTDLFVTDVKLPKTAAKQSNQTHADSPEANSAKVQAKAFAKRHFCITDEIIVADNESTLQEFTRSGEDRKIQSKCLALLVFVDYDMNADTPTLAQRGFEKLPSQLIEGSCVTPWLHGSQPGVGPAGTFGYWMGYSVNMLLAANLY